MVEDDGPSERQHCLIFGMRRRAYAGHNWHWCSVYEEMLSHLGCSDVSRHLVHVKLGRNVLTQKFQVHIYFILQQPFFVS